MGVGRTHDFLCFFRAWGPRNLLRSFLRVGLVRVRETFFSPPRTWKSGPPQGACRTFGHLFSASSRFGGHLFCAGCVLFVFFGISGTVLGAETYCTSAVSEKVGSLQVYHSYGWELPPVLEMKDGATEGQVLITFDEFSHDYYRYGYRIIHCNSDWKRSSMLEMEYLDGFYENDVPEGECSRATTLDYTHYEFLVPNDDIRLKLSGNYAVEVFDRDGDGKALLTACFSVVDTRMALEADVSSMTDLGGNLRYQQVEFCVKTAIGEVRRPTEEIKVLVRQNRRTDNQVYGLQPHMVGSDCIYWDHKRELIFDAGNEYRRFEFIHSKTGGRGVDKIRFERPDYHLFLYADEPRLGGYSYDEDQNGRYLIYTSQLFNDSPVEADYFRVHFCYPMSAPLNPDRLYVLGDLTHNRFDESNRMKWNPDEKAYTLDLMLKQGSYNYMYVAEKNGRMTTDFTEGNYWATENEYEVFIYYRPLGQQYDALVAYTTLVCKP